MNFSLQPYLEGNLVVIRPLNEGDYEDLFKVASDPLIWEQHQHKNRYVSDEFTKFFKESLQSQGALIVLDCKNEKVIGSSRFKIIDELEGVVEIGWSFLAMEYWGGTFNKEIKKLMVNYALNNSKNVVFYVDPRNYRSQHALEKLGAKKLDNLKKSWVLPKNKVITYLINKELN